MVLQVMTPFLGAAGFHIIYWYLSTGFHSFTICKTTDHILVMLQAFRFQFSFITDSNLDLNQGFCIPLELAASEDESQKDSAAGGLGLGEGEGEKDISDQIESEEQLEDARPKGEEKTEENEDCKAC